MGRPVRDLTKEPPFGRLRAIAYVGRKYGGNAYFLCVCNCGEMIEARGTHLVAGSIRSCGCLQRETAAANSRDGAKKRVIHGASGTPEFNSWRAMIRRCYDQEYQAFKDYGGRGIKVCERWLNSFDCFLSDMGPRPEGTTLDRRENSGDYEPGNCRWATRREQLTNTRRNVFLEHDGRRQTLVEWAEEKGLPPATLWARLNVLRWDVRKALGTPKRSN